MRRHAEFLAVLGEAGLVAQSLEDLLAAYAPVPSFDDMAWFAMAFVRIEEVLGPQLGPADSGRFGATAVDIFKWIWTHGWDNRTAAHVCGGGFWWDSNKAYKATITNVQMLYLAAKLHNRAHRQSQAPSAEETCLGC